MIQEVFISGQLGKAIFAVDGNRMLLHVEDPNPRECMPHDLSMFFESGAEYSLLDRSVCSPAEIQAALDLDTRCHDTLRLILGALDPELTETRGLSIEAAEELLQDSMVRSFVTKRLRARPLPDSAQMRDARNIARNATFHAVASLLDLIQTFQPHIKVLHEAWGQAADEVFNSPEEAADSEANLIDFGVFDEILQAMSAGNVELLNSAIVKYGSDPQVRSVVPNAAQLLNKLRIQLGLLASDRPQGRTHSKAKIDTRRKGVTELLEGFESPKRHKRTRKRGGHQAKLTVDAQIEAIAKLVRDHKMSLAEDWLEDLVRFHVSHGKREHLAMSLCKLATMSIDSSEYGFAASLLVHAESLGINDPVVLSMKGNLLRATNRHEEALAEFDDLLKRFPDDAPGRSERAEVLKAMGRLEQALKAYDETVQLSPHNAIVRTGRAEVLKGMGRFEQALKAYDEAVQLFPHNAIARTGRAEVLKGMGRFEQALKAYDETVQLFPDNASARTGRAEVLKGMGRFEQALKAYDEAVQLFPDNAIARTGRAEVLKGMGRFEQALKTYDEAVQLFPHNPIPRNGRAEALKGMGRFEQALKTYDEAVHLFPHNPIPRNGRAEVLKGMGRFEQALRAYDETVQLFPHNAIARTGRAELLKGMGRFEQALKAYDEAVQLFPHNAIARTGRAELLKGMGRFEQALRAYDEAVQLFPHHAIARNGRAEVLKAMGRFEQALASYLETRRQFPYNQYALRGTASILLLMGRLEEAKLLLLPDSAPVSQDDWVKYHIMAMLYMKTEGSLDEAIRRLSHGVQHAPWRESKHVFMNSLAVASIKKQEYLVALEVLKQDIGVLDIVEKQKRFALMGHSQAAIGRTDEAIQSLDGLADVEDPNLLMLRAFLSQRYGLREQWKPTVASISMPILDLQIAQKEFLIALA